MILTGSFTGVRHRAEGSLPADHRQRFAKSLTRYAFVPIDPTTDRRRALGWVNPLQLLDADLTWDKVIFGDHVVLGLRVDERKISKPMLRARVAQVLSERRREKPGVRITREEQSQVARAIESEMLAQTPPVTTVQEVGWNTRTGMVWFSSASKKANEEMMDLFERTFGVRVIPLVPLTAAEAFTEKQGKGGAALERTTPLDLRRG